MGRSSAREIPKPSSANGVCILPQQLIIIIQFKKDHFTWIYMLEVQPIQGMENMKFKSDSSATNVIIRNRLKCKNKINYKFCHINLVI